MGRAARARHSHGGKAPYISAPRSQRPFIALGGAPSRHWLTVVRLCSAPPQLLVLPPSARASISTLLEKHGFRAPPAADWNPSHYTRLIRVAPALPSGPTFEASRLNARLAQRTSEICVIRFLADEITPDALQHAHAVTTGISAEARPRIRITIEGSLLPANANALIELVGAFGATPVIIPWSVAGGRALATPRGPCARAVSLLARSGLLFCLACPWEPAIPVASHLANLRTWIAISRGAGIIYCPPHPRPTSPHAPDPGQFARFLFGVQRAYLLPGDRLFPLNLLIATLAGYQPGFAYLRDILDPVDTLETFRPAPHPAHLDSTANAPAGAPEWLEFHLRRFGCPAVTPRDRPWYQTFLRVCFRRLVRQATHELTQVQALAADGAPCGRLVMRDGQLRISALPSHGGSLS